MLIRPRRNRKTREIRLLHKENYIFPHELIYPIFITEGLGIKECIGSMPNIYRWSLDLLINHLEGVINLGINTIILFPFIEQEFKDTRGSYSLNQKCIMFKAIKLIKNYFPQLIVIGDVALDPYTSHGHDGILDKDGYVLNDETVEVLCKLSVLYVKHGFDFVAPSDMMDGRILRIRESLDQEGFYNSGIMSYAVKYASSLYSPFRDALKSHPSCDKKSYQLCCSSYKEAILEASLDSNEGADILIIKPAITSLDIIYSISKTLHNPIAAFQVSGEYASIYAAANNGWLDLEKSFIETAICMKRAGASMIISYAAEIIAKSITNFSFDL